MVGPNVGVKPIGYHNKFQHIVKQNVIRSARIACLSTCPYACRKRTGQQLPHLYGGAGV